MNDDKRYVIGVLNGNIVDMPTECIFSENEIDLETAVFYEQYDDRDTDVPCPKMGTMDELIAKYQTELSIKDFEEDD